MVKKISGQSGNPKQLQSKRLKLKKLHKHAAHDRSELEGLPADKLPPASSSNAARQARARLNITFPVSWQDPHLKKASERESKQSETDGDIEQED